MNLLTPNTRHSQHTERTPKHSLWVLVLTGLVILTSLACVLPISNQNKQYNGYPSAEYQNAYSEVTSSSTAGAMKALYGKVFGDNPSQPLTTPEKNACGFNLDAIQYAAFKPAWLVPFIVLMTIAYSLIPMAFRVTRHYQQRLRPTKYRLHLTHCIFQE